MSSAALPSRIPDPAEAVPTIALPALGVFVAGLALWSASAALALTGTWPLWASVLPSTVAAYLLFTVAHDAGHRSLSSAEWVNTWLGRFSLLLFAPHASFRVWRFIHMQHHRFTNHEDGSDPDHYTQLGPRALLPLRWATVDLHYLRWYRPHLARRPRGEQVELTVTWALIGAVVVTGVVGGLGVELLLLWLVPARLAVVWLGFAFDFLPHNGLRHTPSEDKLRTTRNRVGAERLLTPLLLYQNYHLVHHLHPTIPFHRYVAVWRRSARRHIAGGAELTTPLGRPLTEAERARLAQLADHHH